LEIVHDVLVFGFGPNVLEANKLRNKHVMNTLDMFLDLHIDKCGVWVLLDVDCTEENGLKLGLNNLRSFFSFNALDLCKVCS